MKRRSFLKALLAVPIIGKAVAAEKVQKPEQPTWAELHKLEREARTEKAEWHEYQWEPYTGKVEFRKTEIDDHRMDVLRYFLGRRS